MKETNEHEEKRNTGSERTGIIKAGKSKQLPVGGLRKTGVKKGKNRVKMESENVLLIGKMIIMVMKKGQWQKKTILFDLLNQIKAI